MNHVAAQIAPARVGRFLLVRLGVVLGLMAGQASSAIQLSPSTLSLPAGTNAVVQITGANGNISVTAANTATVTLSGVSLRVTVTQAPPPLTLAVAPTSLSLLGGHNGPKP